MKQGLRSRIQKAVKEHNEKVAAERERKEALREQVEKTREEVLPGAIRRQARIEARRKARAELKRPTGRLVGAIEEARDVRGRAANKVSRAAGNASKNLRVERDDSASSIWNLPGPAPADKGSKIRAAQDPWNFRELGGPLFNLEMPQGRQASKKKVDPLQLPAWV